MPQPFVVDTRLHFYAPTQRRMDARIPVHAHMCPGWRASGGGGAAPRSGAGAWHVRCTDPEVVATFSRGGINTAHGSSGVPDVHIKCA